VAARLLWNAVWHPFVSGRAARCDAMIELIEYMKSKGGVWFARLDESPPTCGADRGRVEPARRPSSVLGCAAAGRHRRERVLPG
jgi:hypothetical protein